MPISAGIPLSTSSQSCVTLSPGACKIFEERAAFRAQAEASQRLLEVKSEAHREVVALMQKQAEQVSAIHQRELDHRNAQEVRMLEMANRNTDRFAEMISKSEQSAALQEERRLKCAAIQALSSPNKYQRDMFVSAFSDSAQENKSASSSNKQPFLPSESPEHPRFKALPAPEKGDEMSGSYEVST